MKNLSVNDLMKTLVKRYNIIPESYSQKSALPESTSVK